MVWKNRKKKKKKKKMVWKLSILTLKLLNMLKRRLNFLLVARWSLFFACCSLLVTSSSLLVTFCSLLVAFSSLAVTFCSLLFALFARCSLFFHPNFCQIKLLWTAKKLVWLSRNSATDNFHANFWDFRNFFWMVVFKVSSTCWNW